MTAQDRLERCKILLEQVESRHPFFNFSLFACFVSPGNVMSKIFVKHNPLRQGSSISAKAVATRKNTFQGQVSCQRHLCLLSSLIGSREFSRLRFERVHRQHITLWLFLGFDRCTFGRSPLHKIFSIIMNPLLASFTVLVFCSMCAGQILMPCPKECICEQQFFPESQGVGARVNCSSRRLKKFPWPLPLVTTTL